VFRSLAGVYIGDTSDLAMIDQLDRALTPAQQHFIGTSLERIAGVYLAILVVTNALWITGVFYIFKFWKKDDHAA
jgi:hypothetical protein